MSLDGGPAFTICAIPATSRIMDAAWLPDGTIVFAVWRDSLYKVPAAGGTPAVLLQVDLKTEVDFHRVSPLPDGRLIVQTHQRDSDADVVEILDGARRTTLSSDRTALHFQYGGPGRVLFLRESINPGLWSAPFSGTTADLNKAVLIQPAATGFDVARDGTLLERLPEVSRQSLQWLDRKGGTLPAAGEPIDDMNSASVAVSPDGRRVAFITGDGPSANLVVRDLQSGADTPLTFRKPDAAHAGTWTSIYTPSWLPSSDRLLHTTGITAALKIVEGRADAAGDERELATGADAIVSNDGRMLVFKTDAMELNRLRRAPILPDGSVGPVEPVFSKAADPTIGQFDLSPDGRLLAYSARDEHGAFEVYVTDFPAVSGRLLVAKGGTRPRFSRTGELFYVKGAVDAAGRPRGELMSVQVKAGPPIALGGSERLLSDEGLAASLMFSGFSVAPDGRLLIPQRLPPAPGKEARLVVVQNWPALLERRPVP